MKNVYKRFVLPLFPVFLLVNCSAIAPTTSLEISFKYFSFAKGGADLASLSATGKTTNDHFFSAVFGKDCKIARLLKKQPICIEVNSKTFKYKLFKKGDLVSANNVVKMKFPSEMYDFKKAIKKDLLKKPEKINTTIKTKTIF